MACYTMRSAVHWRMKVHLALPLLVCSSNSCHLARQPRHNGEMGGEKIEKWEKGKVGTEGFPWQAGTYAAVPQVATA